MENIDYYRIEKAIKYIETNYKNQPTLDEIADHICLSPFHFQRLFKEWAGVTPKRFIQFLTLEYAKKVLSEGQSIFEASFRSGLSGPSRLHDLFVNIEAVTPGEFKNKGKGLSIYYGFYQSPFGPYMLAVTDRGICALHFTGEYPDEKYLDLLKANWPEADFVQDATVTNTYHKHLFNPQEDKSKTKITLLLKGTNFQLKVWNALLQIPSGCLTSYDTIARKIGNPGASRAVGSAIGANPVGFIIPCHRVINKIGAVGNYRWGSTRKRAIIGWEASQLLGQPEDLRQKMPA
ncbi:methylated-DNA--[protein]-cysteine S-methyltransferase [Fulvivirgaceae bacterium BMA12]|uniref:Methylated-DNA--[protein]-cysteine S-methyltransferase n=1 Tax=Agaribacillus aureus TaxID=3051825 RepID=A0ABT8LAK4_9BACT|nr:methylated-DNA--[protein]-cysteine S-methyltransferase [Fulvivirgaceae bacterium BMA12]